MAQKAPGKTRREGLALTRSADVFGAAAVAEKVTAVRCWPGGPYCPDCRSLHLQLNTRRPTMASPLPGPSEAAVLPGAQGHGARGVDGPASRAVGTPRSRPTSRASLPMSCTAGLAPDRRRRGSCSTDRAGPRKREDAGFPVPSKSRKPIRAGCGGPCETAAPGAGV